MDRVLKRIAIIAAGVLLIGIGGNAVLLALGQWNGAYMTVGQARISDTYIVKSSTAKRLELDSSSGDVRVVRSDVTSPTIRISGWSTSDNFEKEDVVQEEMQGDVLHLRIGNKGNGRSSGQFVFWKLNFELLLPQKEYDELILHVSSGSLQIEALEAGTLKIEMRSGKLKMENCKANEISIKKLSGRADIKNISGKLNVENDSGNVAVSLNEIVNDAVFRSKAGNIELHVGAVSTPFKVEATALSGKMDIDLPKDGYQVHGASSFHGLSGQGDGPLVKVEIGFGRARIW